MIKIYQNKINNINNNKNMMNNKIKRTNMIMKKVNSKIVNSKTVNFKVANNNRNLNYKRMLKQYISYLYTKKAIR